ncbi:MAG: transmembrane 220 family protein [Mucilaginibacter sp.]
MLLIVLNVIFFLSFLVFAYLNLDDIDAWLWVPIYMSAAICCGLVVVNLYYPTAYLVLIGFYMIYAVFLFFNKDGVWDWIVKYKTPSLVQGMKADKPYIEQAREFGGLLIISAALLINYFMVR